MLPEWFKLARDDALLSAKDLRKLLGITKSAFEYRCEVGKIPAPKGRQPVNERSIVPIGQRVNKKRYWTVGQIREFLKHSKETQNEQSTI